MTVKQPISKEVPRRKSRLDRSGCQDVRYDGKSITARELLPSCVFSPIIVSFSQYGSYLRLGL